MGGRWMEDGQLIEVVDHHHHLAFVYGAILIP
jgi:hypothetical protein